MAEQTPEFLIDKVLWNEDNALAGRYAVLIGRCGESPIRKGDVFREVYRYKPGRYPEDMGAASNRLDSIPVLLVVAEIQTLNRPLELLGQGMTGAIFVQGDGLDRLAEDWVIGQPIPVRSDIGESKAAPETEASITRR